MQNDKKYSTNRQQQQQQKQPCCGVTSPPTRTTNNHEFWKRLRHNTNDDDYDDGKLVFTTPTARCGFSWHVAIVVMGTLWLFSVFVVVVRRDDDNESHESTALGVTAIDIVNLHNVVAVLSTMLLALFVAAPMVYFVINHALRYN